MLKGSLISALLASGMIFTAGCSQAQDSAGQALNEGPQVQQVLDKYETALNSSDTDAVMALYAADGVFMPPNSRSAVGVDAVRTAYDNVFKAITLNVDFEVAEVVQIAPHWAYARTNSAGNVRINASGDVVPEANQELFLFKKGDDGVWRISRYAFSTTNPPRQ